jgi:hypothetical protein
MGLCGFGLRQWVMQLRTTKWHPKRWNFRSFGTAPTPLEDAQGKQQTGISMLTDGGAVAYPFLKEVPQLS